MTERGRRGKYARLICRGCRSRKIKCVLPNVHDLGPLNTPQPIEKACERCRHLNLECVVDYTLLGRPQTKRNRIRKSEDTTSRSPNMQSDSVPEAEGVPVLSSLDIKDYLFADEDDRILSQDHQSDSGRGSRKEAIFQSMVHPNSFFVSVLDNDRAFGADVVHNTSSWTTPLQDLISHDMAVSFDEFLVWHRFFLPNLPTLVNLRNRLIANDSSTNCATKLLFSLLALSAFELNENAAREEWRLKRQLQLAISFFGQEFMFSPPTHHDSVMVSLFLSNYKPAALATIQSVAHKTIKSETYINIAYGVFHRLESVTGEGNQDLRGLHSTDPHEFEKCLSDSFQGVQMIANHATVDGPTRKPLQSLYHLTSYLKTRVDAYENVLKSRRCTPWALYHIQWAISTYILFQTLTEYKKNINNPASFIAIAEENEKKCLDQINYCNSLLDANPGNSEEISTLRSLIELRFYAVRNWGVGIGALYSSKLGMRSQEDNSNGNNTHSDSDLSPEDALQLSNQVVNTWNGAEGQVNECLRRYLIRFGIQFVTQIMEILEKFLECSKMKLNGIPFRPPPRYLCLELAIFCKNILENNLVKIRAYGHVYAGITRQIELFTQCAEQLTNMATLPGTTVEAAFAGGCVYAMCSKVVYGFLGIMERLKTDFARDEGSPEMVDEIIASASAQFSDFSDLGVNQFSDGMDLWPSAGPAGDLDYVTNSFDWSSMLNLENGGIEVENSFWFGGQFT